MSFAEDVLGTAVPERRANMRLIDADSLQRRICGAKCGCEYEDCGNEEGCVYDHFISNTPTIDAVPVVRCRECKFGSGCPIIDANIWMDDDDFCSHGERKEGADR